jgi:hypothetical protein
LDKLFETLAQAEEHSATEVPIESVGHPPLVVFLGGIIIGSIAAVFLVLHVNKIAGLSKKQKNP